MATLTLNIDQKAQMAAKEAFDKEYADCIAAGMSKEEATSWAQDIGAEAYDKALEN